MARWGARGGRRICSAAEEKKHRGARGGSAAVATVFRTDESLAGGSNPGATSRGPTVSEIL